MRNSVYNVEDKDGKKTRIISQKKVSKNVKMKDMSWRNNEGDKGNENVFKMIFIKGKTKKNETLRQRPEFKTSQNITSKIRINTTALESQHG